jgi:pimeloyl-ACP methyl ester carboxylesterase
VVTVAAGAAEYNRRKAKDAEYNNPPLGSFVKVDGVSLHYLERGRGPTVVLLHGNGTMVEDWLTAGVFDELAKTHRVVAFDRPGFGHSERPRSRIWTPSEQAALLAAAVRELKLTNATVVGHSFGTLVTIALALDHPGLVNGIVLVGGYYYPSARADVLVAAPPAVPVVGDVLRYTVSPVLGGAMTPSLNKQLFGPAPVPENWLDQFPIEMTLRPSQIRAAAAEAALMVPAAAALSKRYNELKLPVTIVAGKGDRVVSTTAQSERLHVALGQSKLDAVDGAGHMVHHTGSHTVVDAIVSQRKMVDLSPGIDVEAPAIRNSSRDK